MAADPGLARAWIEIYHCHESWATSGSSRSGTGRRQPRRRGGTGAGARPQRSGGARGLRQEPGDARRFVRAEAEYETALRLAPNAAEILIFYIGWASTFGKPEKGADLVERAIRLDPNYPNWANRPFALANFMAGRYGKAVVFSSGSGPRGTPAGAGRRMPARWLHSDGTRRRRRWWRGRAPPIR